jgi:HD superfamily phosphohydrolase
MILRDPVHGLVSFESEEEAVLPRLMDTAEVQRLRRVKQLGVACSAFPGGEHTRFSHAIGAAYVMKKLLVRLRAIHEQLPFWQRVTSQSARDALAAAFLHDVGHGPYSHLFEDSLPGAPHHEVWTERVLLDPSTEVHQALASHDPKMPTRVAALVRGEHELPYLAKAVSGMFDVDRCDYLLRDAHFTGVGYGKFDLDWLLRSLRFGPAESLAIDGAKGLPAIEAFLLARLFMFQQVYLHKATRAAEWMVKLALRRANNLLADGTRLPQTPRAMQLAAFGADIPLADYLVLDDATLEVAMRAWEEGPDPILAELCKRARVRSLYKTLELFGEQATPQGRERAFEIAREIAAARGFDPAWSVGLDVAGDTPVNTKKEELLVVFQKGPVRPLADVSFLLGRLANERLERVRILMRPELRDEVIQALA